MTFSRLNLMSCQVIQPTKKTWQYIEQLNSLRCSKAWFFGPFKLTSTGAFITSAWRFDFFLGCKSQNGQNSSEEDTTKVQRTADSVELWKSATARKKSFDIKTNSRCSWTWKIHLQRVISIGILGTPNLYEWKNGWKSPFPSIERWLFMLFRVPGSCSGKRLANTTNHSLLELQRG